MIVRNKKRPLNRAHSKAELVGGAGALPEQTKTRLQVTLLLEASNWLKEQGNASQAVEELVKAARAVHLNLSEHPAEKLTQVIQENEQLKAQLNQLQSQQSEVQQPDYQKIRQQVLTGLKLGRQASGYRSAVKSLDRFIAQLPQLR